MFNTNQITAQDVNEMTTRIATLNREIEMLKHANPYLKGCALSQNMARINSRRDELETLTAYAAVIERHGVDELNRCEVLSI